MILARIPFSQIGISKLNIFELYLLNKISINIGDFYKISKYIMCTEHCIAFFIQLDIQYT